MFIVVVSNGCCDMVKRKTVQTKRKRGISIVETVNNKEKKGVK